MAGNYVRTWPGNMSSLACSNGYLQKIRLHDYAYDIIWERPSQKDRFVAYGIAKAQSHRTAEVREILQLSKDEFSPYRKRLIKKGLVNGESWGKVSFTLPYFDEYVRLTYEEEHF